jgi:hypothetical protein
MAIASTTLSAAINAYQTQFAVASTTNISAPVNTTGVGSFLFVDRELMQVTGIPVAGTVTVIRGVQGTQAVAHNNTQGVLIGEAASDFPNFQPTISAFAVGLPRYQGINAPVASALAITPPGAFFHVTGTTATATINLPANFVEGPITVIADGVWTWTAAGNIAVAGTVTTAGSTVTFVYDAATSLWYPSRLA